MIIDIIGGGSLGLLYAAKLASNGNKVRVWCRSEEQALILRTEGLFMDGGEASPIADTGPFAVEAGILDDFIDEWNEAPGEWVFLMTKQKDVKEIASRQLARMDEESLKEIQGMICFQNGIGHIELLSLMLPQWHIYSAITTEAAYKVSHNKVFHAGRGLTMIGQYLHKYSDQEMNSKKDEKKMIAVLGKAGFSCDLSKEIDKYVYRKLLINAVINPLTAIWGIRNGELLATEERMDMMRNLFIEGTVVYGACGIVWDSDLWNQIVEVCEMTAANNSSMLKDIREGIPTEVRWINGSIVSMAEAQGIEANYHKVMVQLIEGMKAKEG
ncbi:ketopantoate reductase family protein [Paenibacillus sp. FA6]|uniref:ketopantoate reductase family protein n=1 Tax=Paenibacillus sp. FA6 TaxID=3413029 RepID=UPI003F65EC81